jgi:ribonuclease-3
LNLIKLIPEEQISKLITLQKTLKYEFNNLKLLKKALTHKSYTNEIPLPLKNNERFEFLGDSVLDLIVSNYMIFEYEDLAEGYLSKIRASVVNESCLASLAKGINLGDYLLLGKGEDLSGGREKPSILANSYEALVGAIFCDSDYQAVSKVFLPCLIKKIHKHKDVCSFEDYKSNLQEYTQNRFGCIPFYKVIAENGPSHDKQYSIKAIVQSKEFGLGSGRSKKEAEQIAAKEALEYFLSKED